MINRELLEPELSRLTKTIQAEMDRWQVPGLSMVVVKHDEIVFDTAFGEANLLSKRPVDNHTLFPIASASKAFTAASLAIIMDARQIEWREKVTDLVPDFFLFDETVTESLTIQDLLFHCSGLEMLSSTFLAFLGYSSNDIIQRLRYLKPIADFRSQFQYHNGMYMVAGKVIEAISGQSYSAFLKENIFDPLQMHDTGVGLAPLNASNNAVHPHAPIKGVMQVLDQAAILDVMAPAGGIVSNTTDMANWLKLNLQHGNFMGQQHLSPVSMAKLFTPHTTFSYHAAHTGHGAALDRNAYGLGWFLFDYRGHHGVEHPGGVPGISSLVSLIPEQGIGIVLLANSSCAPFLEAIRLSIYDIALGMEKNNWFTEFWQDYSHSLQHLKQQQAVLAERLADDTCLNECYLGDYSNKLTGLLRIAEYGDGLAAEFGPAKLKIPLRYVGKQQFIFESEDAVGFLYNYSRLIFSDLDKEGQAQTVEFVPYTTSFGEMVPLRAQGFLRQS